MSPSSKVRLGVVQPHAVAGSAAPKMLEDALAYVAEAARLDIDLVVFPETYPGPVSWHTRYEVVPALAEAAAAHGVAIVAGTTEATGDDERAHHIACVVIDRDGEVLGRYRRTHPRGEVYRGLYSAGPFWEFDYVSADELPVFDMGWGILGVSICSEVFVPEVARGLALQGAELCVFPTGSMIVDLGFKENWQTLIRARAIENIMYTATTVNLFGPELRAAHAGAGLPPVDPGTGLNTGHAMIASPEHVLGTMTGPGILTADLDLAYVRRMRADPEFPDGIVLPPPYVSLPGLANLRRPEITDTLPVGP
jgi:predicted amidohydrolase